MRRYLFIFTALLAVSSCKQSGSDSRTGSSPDPLSTWTQTASRQTIIDYVTAVTTEGGPKFIPASDRIAVFDNDGTLWCEQPLYFEMAYSVAATAKIAAADHSLQNRPEIKALAEGDKAAFLKTGEKGILEAFAISHTAVSPDEFDRMSAAWLDTARHARFNLRYQELTYGPMVELLGYLRDNDFKTYIVSGGSAMFIRNFSQRAYGIPPEQVIGTMFQAVFADSTVTLKPDVWLMDDGPGKPEAIFNIIGRKPVLAFGNSDGDLEMLRWTATNTYPNLELLLHHTDSVREYAYDRNSPIGKLDKALDEASQRGWVVVDMKNDFLTVFDK